jgi:hypothetical protein
MTGVMMMMMMMMMMTMMMMMMMMMQVFHPSDRLTVDQALAHPYFESLRASHPMTPPPVTDGLDFNFEQGHLSRW